MKILLDTNILIPLEPTSPGDIKPETRFMTEMARRAARAKAELYYHPAIRQDLERDKDVVRRQVRDILLGKYEPLPSPPAPTEDVVAVFGTPVEGSNDWVDMHLVGAVARHAVDFVLSDDQGVHKRARRLSLGAKVLSTRQAIELFRRLSDETPPPPAALRDGVVHQLDETDPFFVSVATDYKDFAGWLVRAKREHRPCWYSKTAEGRLEALCIVKQEKDDAPPEATGKALKICTFKVADSARGIGLGEQLLKAAFGYAHENAYESVFVTAFEERQPALVNLLAEMGFAPSSVQRDGNESQYWKRFSPMVGESVTGFEANKRFGPSHVDFSRGIAIVPIQPRFVDRLFPEASDQLPLLRPRSTCSNAIRKAYLCRAGIRVLQPGDILLFYRSETNTGVVVVGVVEETLVSAQAQDVAQFAGKRTVYSVAEIEEMASRSEVLAIRFREARVVRSVLTLKEFSERGVTVSPPQSIAQLRLGESDVTWLHQRTHQLPFSQSTPSTQTAS